jgi:DNA end-binding protein Ku
VRAAENAPPAPKKGKKRIEGQKEMLLPIEGKQGAQTKQTAREAPAKKPARAGAKQRKAG